jgi:hypothetical protein
MGDVDAVKIASGIERRTLEEGRNRDARMLLSRPRSQIGRMIAAQLSGSRIKTSASITLGGLK